MSATPHRPAHALSGWTVLSLRPRGQHAALRRAAMLRGARLLALSPLHIEARDDPATRTVLAAALAAPCIVFTSPNAVAAAARMADLPGDPARLTCAVGSGTARALRRAGVTGVQVPARMDSEGVLDLPALADVHGRAVGLVTAPGGRDRIASTLQARGARLRRADVYARVPAALPRRALQALADAPEPLLLVLSSGEALQLLLDQLPQALRVRLRGARVVAASARLATLAGALGFGDVRVAASPRPAALLDAAT